MEKATLFVVGLVMVMTGNDVQNELKKLEGTWDVFSMEVEGKAQPKEKSAKQLIFGAGKLTGLGPPMTVVLDVSKNPKWIDLVFKKGDQSFPIHAIYDLKDDELRICMPVAEPKVLFENKRPENFVTDGKLIALLKAKRAIKKQ
jgi:uncharacterized protein (TIGR03067 family)